MPVPSTYTQPVEVLYDEQSRNQKWHHRDLESHQRAKIRSGDPDNECKDKCEHQAHQYQGISHHAAQEEPDHCPKKVDERES